MKFRTKWIISWSIIAIFILFFTWVFIDLWTLPIFIWVLAIYIIAIIIRSQNYILLDDEWVKQVKCNPFFCKKHISIPYKDIKDIELTTNNNLSKENIWNHCISSVSWSQIQIWKIFHFNKFKSILKDKIDWESVNVSTSTNYYTEYVDKNSPNYFPLMSGKAIWIEIILAIIGFGYIFSELYMKNFDFKSFKLWSDIYLFIPIIILLIFIWVKLYNSIHKKSFAMLWNDSLIIWEYKQSKYNVHKISYLNIEKIEIVILSENDSCFYIKLKNQQLKEAFYWLKDWNAFMNALKMKGINAHFVSSDKMITDLKDEDLY